MHTLFKLTLIAVLFAAGALAQGCGSCAADLLCCAGQCYDNTKASCETGSIGQEVLCGFQHLPAQTPDAVCGDVCYDTLDYGCCNATSTIYGLGSEAAKYCPTNSPTPVENGCSDSNTCDDGLSCCNTQCYNPATAGCETSSTGQLVLCGFQHLPDLIHDAACGTICYDLLYYGCCNATSTIYDLNNPSACSGAPTTAPTAAPTSTPTNANPTTVAPTSSPNNCGGVTCGSDLSCCAGQCYNSSEASCETSNTGAVVLCGFQHLPAQIKDAACGTTCYDTLYYSCCNATSIIVELGQEAQCARTTNLIACGNAMCMNGYECCASSCYDVTRFSCVGNSNNQQMLCNVGDLACGLYCYNPSSGVCCNNQIYGLGDVNLPASCGGINSGNFAGNPNYNGYNGNGGYYYDAAGEFRNCNDNSASSLLMSGFAIVLAVLAASL